jgi:agmatine deiminase
MLPQTITFKGVPQKLGYRFSPEWALHEATWLAWPNDLKTWPDDLKEVESAYLQMIEVLHRGEKVHVLVSDSETHERIARQVEERGISKQVFFHEETTHSVWIRDYGPTFLTGPEGKIACCSWKFNAWGGKYKIDEQDDRISARVSALVGGDQFDAKMVLEGGSFDVNGEGSLLTTEQCLLNPNRNPNFSRQQIEDDLRDYLGVRHFIWLVEGIAGDDTDGHVDTVARFVSPTTVVAGLASDAEDGNHRALRANWKRLEEAVDQNGKPLTLIQLPMPKKVKVGGSRFPASYANFYVANGAVLVPTYRDANDDIALNVLKDLFPRREIVGIPSIPLIYGRGAVHCATLPQPKGVKS